ncbi:DUF2142 domain-containing protein [Paenibacillus ehimensis]|uniref:DUF2142 domain-containing protein n=1 Tax=Paenibacillus ehimensis TaxID=79264 RepID=A0ABT8VH33_9BACL|nr:DUF2142 domain-containing protein [Paenibacillus ehimensis]MDO3680294.1 DUF2142 domain-containing protein [Paenibacillus ehimensis]
MQHLNSNKIENYFINLVLIFGLLLVFIIPPLQMPDEESHFKKAYVTSEFKFFAESHESGKIGNYIPKAIQDFEDSTRYMIGNVEKKYSYSQFYSDLWTAKNFDEKIFSQYSMSSTHPVAYLPQATGMFLTRILFNLPLIGNHDSLTPATYMYAGRIANLIFFIICIKFSIRTIPFFKRVVFLLGLMPMTFSLASSLSQDTVVIGVTFLFISFVFKLAFDEQIVTVSKKQLIYFIIFAVILVELKLIYYLLLFLFLLIPRKKFASIKQYYISFIIIFFSGIISHLLWMLISKVSLAVPGGGFQNNTSLQLSFILDNPVQYFIILINTLIEYKIFYLTSFVGNLGSLDTNFPYLFILCYLILLLVTASIDVNEKISITINNKLISFFIIIAIFVLIETSQYLTWTSLPQIGGIGHRVVSGVQGRYFIPFSILILFMFYFKKLSDFKLFTLIRDFINKYIPVLVIFSCLFTLLILVLRYWI